MAILLMMSFAGPSRPVGAMFTGSPAVEVGFPVAAAPAVGVAAGGLAAPRPVAAARGAAVVEGAAAAAALDAFAFAFETGAVPAGILSRPPSEVAALAARKSLRPSIPGV